MAVWIASLEEGSTSAFGMQKCLVSIRVKITVKCHDNNRLVRVPVKQISHILLAVDVYCHSIFRSSPSLYAIFISWQPPIFHLQNILPVRLKGPPGNFDSAKKTTYFSPFLFISPRTALRAKSNRWQTESKHRKLRHAFHLTTRMMACELRIPRNKDTMKGQYHPP